MEDKAIMNNEFRPEMDDITWDLTVPAHALEGLRLYRNHHMPTGHFLKGVLENDLSAAVTRADPQNLRALRSIMEYVWMEMPGDAWGSPEAYERWINARLSSGGDANAEQPRPEPDVSS